MKILGIETSCDETAAAVVEDGRRIVASIVASQVDLHARYGGIVPEVASRKHLENIIPVVEAALDASHCTLSDLDALAVTYGPGLAGSLLVGLNVAKALAMVRSLPLVGVNHLDGHLSAIMVDRTQPAPEFPLIGLVVSGGHTALFQVSAPGRYRPLGQTLDDAAGEAFDKCAKALGLPYPGGREIEAQARAGDESAICFPRPLLDRDDYNFSFSGLKTAVVNYWEKCGRREEKVPDVAASFQAAAVEVLVVKTMRAAQKFGAGGVVVCGGVAANQRLRSAFLAAGETAGIKVQFPAARLCADNAAMIAEAGRRLLGEGVRHGWELGPRAVWPLGNGSREDS